MWDGEGQGPGTEQESLKHVPDPGTRAGLWLGAWCSVDKNGLANAGNVNEARVTSYRVCVCLHTYRGDSEDQKVGRNRPELDSGIPQHYRKWAIPREDSGHMFHIKK